MGWSNEEQTMHQLRTDKSGTDEEAVLITHQDLMWYGGEWEKTLNKKYPQANMKAKLNVSNSSRR